MNKRPAGKKRIAWAMASEELGEERELPYRTQFVSDRQVRTFARSVGVVEGGLRLVLDSPLGFMPAGSAAVVPASLGAKHVKLLGASRALNESRLSQPCRT